MDPKRDLISKEISETEKWCGYFFTGCAKRTHAMRANLHRVGLLFCFTFYARGFFVYAHLWYGHMAGNDWPYLVASNVL